MIHLYASLRMVDGELTSELAWRDETGAVVPPDAEHPDPETAPELEVQRNRVAALLDAQREAGTPYCCCKNGYYHVLFQGVCTPTNVQCPPEGCDPASGTTMEILRFPVATGP